MLGTFQKTTVVHGGRDQTARADALANLALDEAESRLHDAEREVAGTVAALEGGAGESVRRKLVHECDVHRLPRLPTGLSMPKA